MIKVAEYCSGHLTQVYMYYILFRLTNSCIMRRNGKLRVVLHVWHWSLLKVLHATAPGLLQNTAELLLLHQTLAEESVAGGSVLGLATHSGGVHEGGVGGAERVWVVRKHAGENGLLLCEGLLGFGLEATQQLQDAAIGVHLSHRRQQQVLIHWHLTITTHWTLPKTQRQKRVPYPAMEPTKTSTTPWQVLAKRRENCIKKMYVTT